jgi:hypothetical protein
MTRSKPLYGLLRKYNQLSTQAYRSFSTEAEAGVETLTEAQQLEAMTSEERLVHQAQKFGADLAFNSKRHGYILSFPWNYDEIIKDYEDDFKPLETNNFWYKWIHNREVTRDFSELFRVFHQSCAIHEEEGLDRVCEPTLAQYMKRSVNNIHFHGMDIEMANLKVHQPQIDILNVEVHHGLKVDRTQNKQMEEYDIQESELMGAPFKMYTNKNNDTRSIFDHLDFNYKPYLVSVTALIHSPMKLFVYNQNRSKILFGSDDNETVKNIVKFEINVRWLEFFKLLPVNNKPLLSREWKITDYNNVLNENPYFKQ